MELERTILFDRSANELLTMKDAAKYLDMHLMSIRRLVAWGRLQPRMRVGKTAMLAVEDLDHYRAAGSTSLSNPPPWVVNHLEATVIVKRPAKAQVRKKLRKFTWEKIPFVKRQIIKDYGNVPFDIQVECFDNSRFKLSYAPSKTRSLWKRWAGENWLVG